MTKEDVIIFILASGVILAGALNIDKLMVLS